MELKDSKSTNLQITRDRKWSVVWQHNAIKHQQLDTRGKTRPYTGAKNPNIWVEEKQYMRSN